MKINNTRDIHAKPTYACVYGCSGIGKTSLAKTLPADRTLIVDAESGLASLATTNIDNISLSKDDEGKSLPEEARYQRLQEFMQLIQTPEMKAKYDYIFIDSLTEIGQNIQKHMASLHDGYKLWGEYTAAMMSMIKFFRDMDHYTVVFVALEGRIEDDSGISSAYPDIGGKKAKEYLLPAFDLCMRMIVDSEKHRWLVTQSTPKTQAKDRSGKLAELEAPHLGNILNKIRGKTNEL
jgi:hypothetical protein